MIDWHKLVEFFLIFGAAVMSPGPNFVMVVRHSASSTRKNGLFLTLGFGVGLLVQAGAALAGMRLLFEVHPNLIKVIQYLGATYLCYLGIVGLFSHKQDEPVAEKIKRKSGNLWNSFRTGLLTHLSNPFATLFIFSTFALFYEDHIIVRFTYLTVAFLVVMAWYGTVAVFLTNERLQSQLYRFRHWIDRGAGIILIYVAFKIALADLIVRHTVS